ncbi:MAG: GNAT family N-acetyltransferase [Ruminococcus sp.]|nr:GNAT family N-acetyltransferase [Ruminococcus sp.]
MIREAEKTDLPGCVRVIRESFMTVAEEFGFTEQNAPRFTAFAVTEQRLLWQLDNERRLMLMYCTDSGELIGYYSLLFDKDGSCELNNLCVLPRYRHGGIGAELLRDAFARASEQGSTLMKIGIVEENIRLRRWYEGFGFEHTGTKKYDFFPFTCGYMEKRIYNNTEKE